LLESVFVFSSVLGKVTLKVPLCWKSSF